MENLKKNTELIYNFKNKIINIIKKEMAYDSKSDKETGHKNVDLRWLKYPFEELINEYNREPNFGVSFPDDNRTVNIKNIGNFMNDI